MVELERALMRVYDAGRDPRVMQALQQLLERHQERGYFGTLAVAGRCSAHNPPFSCNSSSSDVGNLYTALLSSCVNDH
jgi:ribosome modulation factor